MNDDAKRKILERVAAGDLPADEAARLLSEDETPRSERNETAHDELGGHVDVIKVVGTFRTTQIVGDPAVRVVSVEGPHSVRREGTTLVVVADDTEDDGGRGFRFSRRDKPKVVIGVGSKPVPLHVRVNPDVPLQVELAAGTLTVDGVRAPIRADVSAGAAKINGIASPVDLSVATGTVHARGVLSSGSSKIRCEAGVVKVHLERGSSVKVRARTGLGKVQLTGGTGVSSGSGFIVGGMPMEEVVGGGDGTLEIESSMGVVQLTSDV